MEATLRRVLPFVLLAACAPARAPLDGPFAPALPTGGCGLPDYTWASMDGMGEVIDWQYDDTYSMSATQIRTVLGQVGVTAFAPEYGVRVYLVRYQTQDHGAPVEATGFLAFPDVDTDQRFPSMLWLHGTTGFNDSCAPTALGLIGVAPVLYIASQGFAVAAPDYLGLAGWGAPSEEMHPWVVPEATAIASLDALRALWKFSDHRPDPPNHAIAGRTYALWGVSEGGEAAFWTDRYAAHYLPGTEEVAAVASVPPTDVLGIGQHAMTHYEGATRMGAEVVVAQRAWYEGDVPLTDVLQPDIATALPQAMESGCSSSDVFAGLDSPDQVFTPSFLAGADTGQWNPPDPWGCYLRTATLHDSAVPREGDTPFLFQISGADDVVVADVERQDFSRLCDQGYTLDYLECAGAGHEEGALQSLPYQFSWLQDRVAGFPLSEDTCTVRAPVDCSTFENR